MFFFFITLTILALGSLTCSAAPIPVPPTNRIDYPLLWPNGSPPPKWLDGEKSGWEAESMLAEHRTASPPVEASARTPSSADLVAAEPSVLTGTSKKKWYNINIKGGFRKLNARFKALFSSSSGKTNKNLVKTAEGLDVKSVHISTA